MSEVRAEPCKLDENFISVCKIADVDLDQNRAFKVDGRPILVCHTKKGWFAVQNRCSHADAELDGGMIKGHFLFCPLHSARFDLRDGSTNGALTQSSIDTFAIKLAGDEVLVNITAKPD